MLFKTMWTIVLALFLTACTNTPQHNQQVSFPYFKAWYEGKDALYIITDISDQEMAKAMKANYAPRLKDAIPRYPKPPQVKTALERVYVFPNKEQSRSVFPSAPEPVGYLSENRSYSPLWIMYTVVWKDPSLAYDLKSEEAIFVAEDKGLVTIERTDIVINCPVVPFVVE